MFKNGRAGDGDRGGRPGLDDPTASVDAIGTVTVLQMSVDYLGRRPFPTTNTWLATRQRRKTGGRRRPPVAAVGRHDCTEVGSISLVTASA